MQQRQKHEQERRTECKNECQTQENEDFMAFIRIIRVHCIEAEDSTLIFLHC